MNKKEALIKLQERINELEELEEYKYKSVNTLFDKWRRRTQNTIDSIFDVKYLKEFNRISFITMGAYTYGDNTHRHIKAHNDGRIKAKAKIESFMEEIEEFWEDENSKQIIKEPLTTNFDKSKVFIVHGHNDSLVAKVQLFLKKVNLEGIVLHEQANLGKVILEKLEHYTDVGFAIILYTPCDLGKAKDDDILKARARQNVVFEHGYLMGKLGRENVAILIDGKIETPGDISGAVYSSAANHWQFDILKELKEVGYDVSADNLF